MAERPGGTRPAAGENRRVAVRDAGDHPVIAEDGPRDARGDTVDGIVGQCPETGTEVRFVPDGLLEAADGRGAAPPKPG